MISASAWRVLAIHRMILAVSAVVQLGFAAAFLIVPERVFGWGGLLWDPNLASMTINLGCLIAFIGVASVLAFRWSVHGADEGIVLGICIGATLTAMGALHVQIGALGPVVFDGGRGILLLASGFVVRLRRGGPAVEIG